MKIILVYTYQWFVTVIYNQGYDYGSVSLSKNITLERAQKVAYITVRNSIGGIILLLFFYSALVVLGPCFLNFNRTLDGNFYAVLMTLLLLIGYGFMANKYLKPVFKDIVPLEITPEVLKRMNHTYLAIKFLLPFLFIGFLLAGSYLIRQLEKFTC